MYGELPSARPSGLRRRALPASSIYWRLDTQPPPDWTWSGFPTPRNRFDPTSGRFRVRYAASSPVGAARERYLATGRYIPADHRHHQVVQLEAVRPLRVLDLRTEANLDAIDADDRISTSRETMVWTAAHLLADAVRRWWPDLDGLLYRSRTTPTTSVNLAIFSLEPFRSESTELGRAGALLDQLVLEHQFTVGWQL